MSKKIEFVKDQLKSEFGILKKWTNTSVMDEKESFENLQNLLSFKFKEMLDNDFNSILNILYRADVSEKKVKQVFDDNFETKDLAKNISELYIARMIEKWETRQKYSSDEEGDW